MFAKKNEKMYIERKYIIMNMHLQAQCWFVFVWLCVCMCVRVCACVCVCVCACVSMCMWCRYTHASFKGKECRTINGVIPSNVWGTENISNLHCTCGTQKQ